MEPTKYKSSLYVYCKPSVPRNIVKEIDITQELTNLIKIIGFNERKDSIRLSSFIETINKLYDKEFELYNGEIKILYTGIIANAVPKPLKLQVIFSEPQTHDVIENILNALNFMCEIGKFKIEKLIQSIDSSKIKKP
ncbi:MAG: hypothetical protein K2H61_02255 [Muribaculaceae bacterium]|nr:hypothetical protein [Muribaculaceae bacterium]